MVFGLFIGNSLKIPMRKTTLAMEGCEVCLDVKWDGCWKDVGAFSPYGIKVQSVWRDGLFFRTAF